MSSTSNNSLPLRHFLRRFAHPINVQLVERIRSITCEASWIDACKYVLDVCHVTIASIDGEFVSEGPQLILFNHATPLDLCLMGAALDRPDIHFVGLAKAADWFGEEGKPRMFGFYLSQQPSPYLLGKVKNHVYHRLREGIDGEEARRRNAIALLRAAKGLDEGLTLAMAPTGGTFVRTKDWKTGVGALLKLVRNPEVPVVFCGLEGGSRTDLLRLMNPYWIAPWVRQPKEIQIRVSPPIRVQDFREGAKSSDEISERVRQRFLAYFGFL